MDLYRDLRLLALANVLAEDDSEYSIRKVFRWYSKEFFTPLHMVEDLPLDEIMTHYYESHYEALEGQDVQEEISQLMLTPEEVNKVQTGKELEAMREAQFLQSVEKQAYKAGLRASLEKEVVPPKATKKTDALEDLGEEKISMSFVEIGDLEKALTEMGGLWTEPEDDTFTGVE